MRVWNVRIQRRQPLHHASIAKQIGVNPRNLAYDAKVFGAETSTRDQSKNVLLMVQVAEPVLESDGCDDIQGIEVHVLSNLHGLPIVLFQYL